VNIEAVLTTLKDYFTFNIPVGVVLIIVFVIIYVFSHLFKEMKIGYETQFNDFRKTHKSLINAYKQKEKASNKRISDLEKMLDQKLKGGKKK
jgi:hypothetical protein